MPTISEIKKLYPVGTVFFPAHLSNDDGHYVTIKDYHTYPEKSTGRIELGNMKPGDSIYQPVICDVLPNGAVRMAKIISLGSPSLPKNWYVEVEPGILDLVNAYRDLKENTPIDYPYYKYMDDNGTENRVAPKSSGTKISITQFIKLCEDLGIKKTSSKSLPTEWACYIKDINNQEKLDLFNAYRVSKYRGLDELSLEDINNRETETYFHEDACRSSTLSGRSIIPFSKFEELCKSLGITKSTTSSTTIPRHWAFKITPNNLDLINAFRRYEGLNTPIKTNYNYDYIKLTF